MDHTCDYTLWCTPSRSSTIYTRWYFLRRPISCQGIGGLSISPNYARKQTTNSVLQLRGSVSWRCLVKSVIPLSILNKTASKSISVVPLWTRIFFTTPGIFSRWNEFTNKWALMSVCLWCLIRLPYCLKNWRTDLAFHTGHNVWSCWQWYFLRLYHS